MLHNWVHRIKQLGLPILVAAMGSSCRARRGRGTTGWMERRCATTCLAWRTTVRTDAVLETTLNAICPWDRSVKALPVIDPGWL